MRITLAIAAVCSLTAAYAPAPTMTAPVSPPTLAAEPLPSLDVMMLAQLEGSGDERGACVHRVSTYKMCNDITRQWCITGGFAYADFYPGITCADAKSMGYF